MTRIHQIKLSISNCYLVESSKNILVDTGTPGEAGKIVKELKARGFSLSDISLILHTHGHSDHCGSTAELLMLQKITTAIHSADRQMIELGKNDFLKTTGLVAKFVKPFVDKPFPPFKADVLIDEYNDLNNFGVNAIIHNTPGHTKGSISIEFDNKEAIIGDLLMGGFFGGTVFPHLPGYHYFADDLNEVKNSIQKVLGLNLSKYYVGHGGPLSAERVKKWFN
jgi:hydroxyacylglutathione hydrolase